MQAGLFSYGCLLVLIRFRLLGKHFVVQSPGRHQLVMGTVFYNPAVSENSDPVTKAGGGQSVRYKNRRFFPA